MFDPNWRNNLLDLWRNDIDCWVEFTLMRAPISAGKEYQSPLEKRKKEIHLSPGFNKEALNHNLIQH